MTPMQTTCLRSSMPYTDVKGRVPVNAQGAEFHSTEAVAILFVPCRCRQATPSTCAHRYKHVCSRLIQARLVFEFREDGG